MCEIEMNSHSSINFQNDTYSSIPGILLETQISVYNNAECTKGFERAGKLISPHQFDDSILCAGNLAGGNDSCLGDSGNTELDFFCYLS